MLVLRVTAARTARYLLALLGIILTGHVAAQIAHFWLGVRQDKAVIRLLDMDIEQSVPTYFAVMLLLGAAVILAWIAAETRASKRPMALMWAGLSAIFVFLSIDEFASIHEVLIAPLHRRFHTSGALYFAWVIPYAAFALGVGVFYARFLWRLPRRTATMFVLAGAIYVAGALGMEMVDGAVMESFGEQGVLYIALSTVEETLECLGTIGFIYALVDYACQIQASVDITAVQLATSTRISPSELKPQRPSPAAA